MAVGRRMSFSVAIWFCVLCAAFLSVREWFLPRVVSVFVFQSAECGKMCLFAGIKKQYY